LELAPKHRQASGVMFPTPTKLRARAPGALLRRLIGRAAGSPATVERELTVMFTDIAGFTGLAETLPPHAIARFLSAHFGSLAGCIERERGTVGKLLGDGLLAFWDNGSATAPALRSAVAIRAAIQADNRLRAAAGLRLVRLRVGLHAGPSAMARLRSERRPTPLGDTVNVAQRLEDAARHHGTKDQDVTIVASDAVVARAGAGFRFEPLGALPVRGRREPVRAFRLA
jgi:adenylate cyclase